MVTRIPSPILERARPAAETFAAAAVCDVVQLVDGDGLAHLPGPADIAFCFLDAEKDVYRPCYEAVIPGMVAGAILVADNAISHGAALQPFLDRALSDPRVDSLIIPIGTGELLCRKLWTQPFPIAVKTGWVIKFILT